jgi:CYTH domain-containing protein
VQEFDVQHDFIVSTAGVESRIRKRGQGGSYIYTITEKKVINGVKVESVRPLSVKEYETLYRQRDPNHKSVLKTRRCFLWNTHYFQLDIFTDCTERCHGLLLLETYTTKEANDLELPPFLEVVREVTNEPQYSMFNLSDTRTEHITLT